MPIQPLGKEQFSPGRPRSNIIEEEAVKKREEPQDTCKKLTNIEATGL